MPFHGNTSYSASDGGHIYLDGNGDRLNLHFINIPVVGWTMTMIIDIPTQNQSWWNYFYCKVVEVINMNSESMEPVETAFHGKIILEQQVLI